LKRRKRTLNCLDCGDFSVHITATLTFRPPLFCRAIGEASYRTHVQNAGKKQTTLTPGWDLLGLEKDDAQAIFDEEAKQGFVSDREAMYGKQSSRYDEKGRLVDRDGNLINEQDKIDSVSNNDNDDDGANSNEPVSNVYECGECGYTLFIAQGRETKFYGTDFKCPECGAAKSKFKPRDNFGDDE
jgi:rubrerythrin